MKRSQTICIVNSHFEHHEVRPDAAFSTHPEGVVCEQVGVRWLQFQIALEIGLKGPAGKDAQEKCVVPSIALLDCAGKRGQSCQFHQHMHDADIDRAGVRAIAARKLAKRSLHYLRRSLVSDPANSGSKTETQHNLTKHKTTSVHDFYTPHGRETLWPPVHAIQSIAARPEDVSQLDTIHSTNRCGQLFPFGDNRQDVTTQKHHFMSHQCYPTILPSATDLSCGGDVKDLHNRRNAPDEHSAKLIVRDQPIPNRA